MRKPAKEKYYLKEKKFGFTLIELLVAMAIMGVLAASLWGSFFSSVAKGRDSRRKQDLELIAKALDIYYYDLKTYPTALPTPGTPFNNPSNASVIYMPKLPGDPMPGRTYCYSSSDGSNFRIYTILENTEDSALITPVSCNGINTYNYGLSSPNTTVQ